MSTAASAFSSINGAALFRRVLFFAVLIILSLYYLLVQFQGLSAQRGMEQASIARELARNNGLKSKVLRPVAIWQSGKANEDGRANLVQASRDTYHSPLYPILLAAVLKAVNGDDADSWRMAEEDTIYQLDRVIAAVSVFCFLMAIGVNYFLICRIFDNKIAGVVALLMLLCDLNWQFSLSGLPQMFMLLLFSCASFFAYRAVENTEGGSGIALTPALIAGVFLGLLALTHWLAVWMVFGFVLYAAFFMRPRGVAGIAALLIVLLFTVYPLIKNYEYTNSPGGTAFLSIFNGLTGFEDWVMRGYDLGDSYLPLQNLPFSIIKASFQQADNLYSALGSIPTAPLFFLALLHPFKRGSIASFRWCILLMWGFAVLGMAIFGTGDSPLSSNQLHLLFAPLMAAYGLALVAILWARVQIPEELGLLRNVHIIIIVLLCSGPMMMELPTTVRGLANPPRSPHWPPYVPSALNIRLPAMTLENEIVVSDQPWAVAWYADRTSLWLPRDPDTLQRIERMAEEENTPIAGILVSPYSTGIRPLLERNDFAQYAKFGPLVLDGWASLSLGRRPGALAFQSNEMKALLARYPHPIPFNSGYLVYWSAQPVFDSANR